ncbi:MAG: hypothetical protein ACSLE6_12225 [Mycobacterium sp.]
MGASERNKRDLPKPRAVLWQWDNWSTKTGHQPPHPAILLEWRRVELAGRPDRWEGLIVFAMGGGELGWAVQMKWVNGEELSLPAPP